MGVGWCYTLSMMATCSSSLGPKRCALGFAAERLANKLRAPKVTVSFIGLLGAL
jgi:hypothetical protein